MGLNIVEKILQRLGVALTKNKQEIALPVEQTLTQDSTGTMAYLQLEAMGIDRVKTKLSVAYIDHNILQCGFENADDHRYIQTVAARYGIVLSKPGNGICHQVHLERFAKPGLTLLGSDSHTPTAGGLGMLAIGAGGLDVALAMAGKPYNITMPDVVRINLKGRLPAMVSAKDIILEMLRRLTVKGGVGRIFEYGGDLSGLSVTERATIANMGAELGATASIFPADEVTKRYLQSVGREADFSPLRADDDAEYALTIDIDLAQLEPLVACPHSPDNVKPVRELAGMAFDQVCIGSCTNSSFADMAVVAAILRHNKVAENVSLTISPGSKQVLTAMADCGVLGDMLQAGARILEAGCGPCLGIGQSPLSGGVSLRTFNRNFSGRSGTADASVYLLSPETAAVSAVRGVLSDPREWPALNITLLRDRYSEYGNDNLLIWPPDDNQSVAVVRGPNIKPVPCGGKLANELQGKVVLIVGDNITTDHIMPSPAKLASYRSNIPYLADYCFYNVDAKFPERARSNGNGIIVGGENYGQGSSREHAALVPLYLGIKAVIAKSFARIHRANLINFGILPLQFADSTDYEKLQLLQELFIADLPGSIVSGSLLQAKCGDQVITLRAEFSARERELLLAGGALNWARSAG